ncbi:T9SS type A sorting domain-containing protein [Bacteroidales bacterium OttesenSCG-928-J16]|nr:T9SS type A sorting domain-containing protein [Bacteroidales bacterium OttesenSCG-928-J16]
MTDEAENYISQVLEPLFYCGKLMNIENFSAAQLKHSVFPNPFSESVTVELEKPLRGSAYFEVYDLTGRIVHQQKIAGQASSFSWNGNYLKEGVYIYAIYSEEGATKGKIVKR